MERGDGMHAEFRWSGVGRRTVACAGSVWRRC